LDVQLGGWQRNDIASIVAALILRAVVSFTLIVVFPTNKRLLDSALDAHSAEAAHLLNRWGRLHAVRSVSLAAAFSGPSDTIAGTLPYLAARCETS